MYKIHATSPSTTAACSGLRATGNSCDSGEDGVLLLASPHCCDHYLACAADGLEYEMPCAAFSGEERLWFDAELGVR